MNEFKIGDILEICFHPEAEKPEWIQFFIHPLRDDEDVEFAKKIVESSGACLGVGSAALVHSQPHGFRTITPPASTIKIEAKSIDHFYNTKTGALIGIR